MFWMHNADLMSIMQMDFPHLQTMLFLQLAAGGHLLLFVVRTRRTEVAVQISVFKSMMHSDGRQRSPASTRAD
jgi:hypothetical protein